jgi:hypothetical protein
VSVGEDRSLIHQGQGPTVMALLRDAAVSLLQRAGVRQLQPACATTVSIPRPRSPYSWRRSPLTHKP